ncbi:MAG: 50S ribosomal protein L11 methyltransferase [Hyphomicrobiaceae bacterium]
MTSTKLVIDLADRGEAHTVAGALQDLVEPLPEALTLFESGGGGWRIDAYYDDPPAPDGLRDRLAAAVGADLAGRIDIRLDEVPDLNWVALSQAALPPVRAGRFTVHGSHDRHRVPQGPGALLIEAGEAFGTAHHATTYGCLLALDRITRSSSPRNVLDLGTGSGVLAIALSRALPKASIAATDIDAPSIEVARQNARANRAGHAIGFAVAAGLRHRKLVGRRFDLVVANILADPLMALARPLARHVVPGGRLVLSGILLPQAPRVIATFIAAGFTVQRHARISEWSTIELVRRAG